MSQANLALVQAAFDGDLSALAVAVAPTEAFAAVAAAPPRQPSARRLHLAMRLRRP
jgi:hypothetical protein